MTFKTKIQIAIVLAAALLLVYLFRDELRGATPVADFISCAARGYPIQERYPRVCRTPSGSVFTEDIGDEREKENLIRLSFPRPNSLIVSPLSVKGMARGRWFFEASFPIELYDEAGTLLGGGVAQAQGEWMTEEFVPFEATITFPIPAREKRGRLMLRKDNPSGLPENDDALVIPVRFAPAKREVARACVVTGCSREVCAEEKVVSICVFKPEYACYRTARCEWQASGQCGWTDTEELRRCLIQTAGSEYRGIEIR